MQVPRILGRYEVIRPIGEGAMGRVLLAKDRVLGRRVAIKMLRPDLGLEADARRLLSARLRLEARTTAGLSHPNLVTIHDLGEDDAVGLYLVFEYVDGLSLREQLAQGPLPGGDVARLARELGTALSYAHDAGLLHRDVKPGNVLLGPTGSKLSDLGLVRLAEQATAMVPPSTTAYTAPEALRADNFGPHSDQFSLAATLYEALSAQRAFSGSDSLTIATHIMEEEPRPIAQETRLDARVDAVLRRALSKDPELRFTSCRAFGEALAIAIEQSPSVSTHPSDAAPRSVSLVPRKTRRVQNMVAGIALVVIVVLFFLGRRTPIEGISLKSVAGSFVAVLSSHAPTATTGKRGVTRKPNPPSTDEARLDGTEPTAEDAGDAEAAVLAR